MYDRDIRLAKHHVEYVKNADYIESDLRQELNSIRMKRDNEYHLKLDAATAEAFRLAFTIELATVGFGEDFEPTKSGRLLEELIDRFTG